MFWLRAQNFASGATETNPIIRCDLSTINKISSHNFTVTLSYPRGWGWWWWWWWWDGRNKKLKYSAINCDTFAKVLLLRTYRKFTEKFYFPHTKSYFHFFSLYNFVPRPFLSRKYSTKCPPRARTNPCSSGEVSDSAVRIVQLAGHALAKFANIKLHKNPLSCCRVVTCSKDRQDMAKPVGAFYRLLLQAR